MKDFAKSIVCNAKAEVAKIGNYNPRDYENDPNHKWTVKSIENEIDKTRRRLDLNRRRIQDLRSMVNSRQFGPSTLKELKDEEKDYEANQMRIKQLVSMLRRATGNELPDEMISVGNAYTYAGSIPIEKIPDNWRPEFPKAGYVVYYAPNKAKWFATEAEAKRFAESQDKAQKTGNEIHDDQINGPAAQEIRETAGRVYKKEMREDDLARATAFELAKKYKNFQKSSSFMETIKDVLKKFKTGNSKVGNSLVLRDGKYIIEQLEQSSTDKYAEKYFGMKKGNYCLKNTKTGVVLGWYTTLDAAKKSMEKWKDDDRVWGNSKIGNSIYSELNKGDKRVVIESDGSWYVYDKNDKIVEQGRESNSDNAFGKFKAKGYNKKACNQDGVARMFEGLVKDENKETEKDSGARIAMKV